MILPKGVLSIGDYIEFPDMAELLMMPMFNRADADDYRKHATDFQKMILDKTPLRNDRKYVSIHCYVQFLHPNNRPAPLLGKGRYENEWHLDRGNDLSMDCHWHLMISKCTAMTEFSKHDIEVDEKLLSSLDYVNSLSIEPVPIESNKIHTFTQYHIHSAQTAQRPELRLFYRVMETDFLVPVEESKSCYGIGLAYRPDGEGYASVEHVNGGVVIRY